PDRPAPSASRRLTDRPASDPPRRRPENGPRSPAIASCLGVARSPGPVAGDATGAKPGLPAASAREAPAGPRDMRCAGGRTPRSKWAAGETTATAGPERWPRRALVAFPGDRKSSTVAATIILAAVPREVVVPGVMTGPLIQPAVAGQVVV